VIFDAEAKGWYHLIAASDANLMHEVL
jgi:hypothetical protein